MIRGRHAKREPTCRRFIFVGVRHHGAGHPTEPVAIRLPRHHHLTRFANTRAPDSLRPTSGLPPRGESEYAPLRRETLCRRPACCGESGSDELHRAQLRIRRGRRRAGGPTVPRRTQLEAPGGDVFRSPVESPRERLLRSHIEAEPQAGARAGHAQPARSRGRPAGRRSPSGSVRYSANPPFFE